MVNRNYLAGLLPNVVADLERKNRESLYFNDPVLWAKDFLGITLWDAQGDALRAVVENKNVAVKAGHGVGKSLSAGVLICWWIDTRAHLPGGAFVVSTAPSVKQINAIVWREVRRFFNLSKKRHKEYIARLATGSALGEYEYCDHELPGYITADAHWKLNDGVELGYGAKPPDSKDDTMSGIHARYVLAVGDEAVGLSESLIGDLGNITSNATSRRFLICNPTNPASYVGKIFKEKTGTWEFRTISVFDSPNFHGEGLCDCERHRGVPVGLGLPQEALESIVDQSYVDGKVRDYGTEHPEYIARVLGEFAWDAGPMLISPEELAVALDTEVVVIDERPVLGVDVSRSEKGDMNAVYECTKGFVTRTEVDEDGNEYQREVEAERVRFIEAWNERDAMKTAQRIHDIALSMGAHLVIVDGSGLGGPIADQVRVLSGGRYLCADALGGKPAPGDNRDRFYNIRAWWYSELRRKVSQGLLDIDHEDNQLQEELLSIQTKFPNVGVQRLLIESKEDMKRRGVGSPDYADAAMYSQVDIESSFAQDKSPRRALIEFDDDLERVNSGFARVGGYASPI